MIKYVVSMVAALALLGPAYALACPGHGDAGEHACACQKKAEEKPCCAKKAEGEGCDCASCDACAATAEEGEEKGCGCGKAEEAA